MDIMAVVLLHLVFGKLINLPDHYGRFASSSSTLIKVQVLVLTAVFTTLF